MKKIIICLMLLPISCFSQKWYAISKNDIGGMLLQSISGSADGFNQAIAHHKLGEGKSFWDYKTSWKRKYKDFDNGDKSAAFIGSKTYLVFITDGYHLTRFIDRSSMVLNLAISGIDLKQYPKKDRWKVIVKKVLLSALVNRIAFSVVYN